MRRDETTKPGDLDRPEGNDLKTNYDKHDVGEAEFVRRCEAMGLAVADWGIDMRNDSGESGIIYDDAMDFKVYRGDELVAIVDVKTKSGPRYMGRFNLRHYEHYREHAADFHVPAFVVMFQVDYKTGSVHDEFVFRVLPDAGGDIADSARVQTSKDCSTVDVFPDGNHTVQVKHSARGEWSDFMDAIEDSKTPRTEAVMALGDMPA